MPGTTKVVYVAGIGNHQISPVRNRMGCSYDLSSAVGGLFDSAPDPTNADSVPPTDYFDTQWGCSDWITWYKANLAKYGQAQAVQQMIYYAGQVNSFASDHFCPYEPSFANYFATQGISFDNFVATASVAVQNTGTAAGNVLTNLDNAANNVSGTLTWLAPVALIVGVIGVAWWVKSEFIDKPKVTGHKPYKRSR